MPHARRIARMHAAPHGGAARRRRRARLRLAHEAALGLPRLALPRRRRRRPRRRARHAGRLRRRRRGALCAERLRRRGPARCKRGRGRGRGLLVLVVRVRQALLLAVAELVARRRRRRRLPRLLPAAPKAQSDCVRMGLSGSRALGVRAQGLNRHHRLTGLRGGRRAAAQTGDRPAAAHRGCGGMTIHRLAGAGAAGGRARPACRGCGGGRPARARAAPFCARFSTCARARRRPSGARRFAPDGLSTGRARHAAAHGMQDCTASLELPCPQSQRRNSRSPPVTRGGRTLQHVGGVGAPAGRARPG